jgi:hypothetical protein
MDAVKTHIDNQSDVKLSFFLQIPQGSSVELKVEQGNYHFYLNETLVKQILQAQKVGYSLDIPLNVLVPLWYYACFNNYEAYGKKQKNTRKRPRFFYFVFIQDALSLLVNKSLENQTIFQSGLTFNSYYRQTDSPSSLYQDQDNVLQSIIFFDGDIIHKICRIFLKDTNCYITASAHYWLTEQLLTNFRTSFNLLTWEIACFAPAGSLAWELYNKVNISALLSIFTWVGAAVVFAISRYLFVHQLQKQTFIQSKYLNWFAWEFTWIVPIILNPKHFLFWLLLSLIVPPVVKRALNLILPQVGRFIMRWLLS